MITNSDDTYHTCQVQLVDQHWTTPEAGPVGARYLTHGIGCFLFCVYIINPICLSMKRDYLWHAYATYTNNHTDNYKTTIGHEKSKIMKYIYIYIYTHTHTYIHTYRCLYPKILISTGSWLKHNNRWTSLPMNLEARYSTRYLVQTATLLYDQD